VVKEVKMGVKISKRVIFLLLMIMRAEHAYAMDWLRKTALYKFISEKQEGQKQETINEGSHPLTKWEQGKQELAEKGLRGGEKEKKNLPFGEQIKRTFTQTINPRSVSAIVKDYSFKLGLTRNQRYPFLIAEHSSENSVYKEYYLGADDSGKPQTQFSITSNDEVAHLAVIQNKKNEYKFAVLAGRREEKRFTSSTLYLGSIQNDGQEEQHLSLMNGSEKSGSNIIDQATNKKMTIINPTMIASNGQNFYFTQAGNDKLYKLMVPEHLFNDDSFNQQQVKTYAGFFKNDLTATNLAKVQGDFKTGDVFFASKAPNLYHLDENPTIRDHRDNIAGAGYLLDVYQNTLIYGRLYDTDKWYEVLWNKFKGKLKQFAAFTGFTESGGKKGTTVRRIGYYAKFYGADKPRQISMDEDYEEAKMMSPIDTVIYGDVVKQYVMQPAAASAKFAVMFIGRRRNMHLSIQRVKGMLFPKMLSWYKILKHSIFADGGIALGMEPEDTLPRKLFIVQHKEHEHYVCIIMRSHVFLMCTPLEKIENDPNKNYNVAMSCIYKPEDAKKKIVASSFFAMQNFNDPQPLFLVIRNDEAQDLRNKFKLLFFDDLHTIIDAEKVRFAERSEFNGRKMQWNWVKAGNEPNEGEEESEE
jgi:hypothetical protein